MSSLIHHSLYYTEIEEHDMALCTLLLKLPLKMILMHLPNLLMIISLIF